MSKFYDQKDARVDIRVSMEQLLAIEAQALMSGLNRSDFVRSMINKSWGNRLAKAHRPYVSIVSVLIDISAKLVHFSSRETLSTMDKERLEETRQKLDNILGLLIERMAIDQEEGIDADHEEEAFE